MSSKLAAVKWFHRVFRGVEIHIQKSTSALIRGVRRADGPATHFQPVTEAMLRAARKLLLLHQPEEAEYIWGVLVLAYFFLLRRSEYLQIGKAFHNYALQVGDIALLETSGRQSDPEKATSVMVTFRGSKSDQFGRGKARFHSRSTVSGLCPVLAAAEILRGHATAPRSTNIGRTPKGRTITAEFIASLVKSAARTQGAPPELYSTHSLRIGGATAMMNAGAGDLLIKFMGRWASDCYQRYPAHRAAQTTGLARMMVQTNSG